MALKFFTIFFTRTNILLPFFKVVLSNTNKKKNGIKKKLEAIGFKISAARKILKGDL